MTLTWYPRVSDGGDGWTVAIPVGWRVVGVCEAGVWAVPTDPEA